MAQRAATIIDVGLTSERTIARRVEAVPPRLRWRRGDARCASARVGRGGPGLRGQLNDLRRRALAGGTRRSSAPRSRDARRDREPGSGVDAHAGVVELRRAAARVELAEVPVEPPPPPSLVPTLGPQAAMSMASASHGAARRVDEAGGAGRSRRDLVSASRARSIPRLWGRMPSGYTPPRAAKSGAGGRYWPLPLPPAYAAMRRMISSSERSSRCCEMIHRWPKGSRSRPSRAP